jgi:hypothetical protein
MGILRTMNVWLPIRLNSDSMLAFNTRMAVITTIIEKTPMRTPSNVSAEL